MEQESNFEADMNALMGETPGQEATPTVTPPTANPSEALKSWKAGGREFKDPSEMAKAHDALWRDYGRKSNELKGLEEWKSFASYLEKHPELRTGLAKQIQEYQKGKQAGQSTTTAAAGANMSPDVAARLERAEAFIEDQELDREVNALRGKYKVDSDTMNKVFEFSKSNGGIPLEVAYKAVAYESQIQKAKDEGKSEAAKVLQKAKDAHVGSSVAPNVQPSPKGISLAGDNEWRKAGLDELGKYMG